MAHMYPNRLLADTQSDAERKLYDLFHHKLSDEFTVFHSVAWLAHAGDGRAHDGEADFLVAHPDLGLLVLEVKGGRIELDGPSGEWFSIDRNDTRHRLKRSPYTQAKEGCYSLLRKLQDNPSTSAYSYPTGYAVCFPDVVIERDLLPDAPAAITIDQRGVLDIEARIRAIYAYHGRATSGASPTRHGIQTLITFLAPKLELRSYMGLEFQSEAEQIKRLTQEQFRVLDMLNRERRAVIYGCAGSGKTMLALEKARRLTQEGYAVLFTCYNARLAEWLRSTPYAHEGVTIIHFHKLCVDLARRARITIPDLNSDVVEGDEELYYGTILPNALMEAAAKRSPQYNAIIVDEGQDLIDTWWVALEGLLTDPAEDVFYIFCDDNQNIYAGAAQNYPFRDPHMTLSINCRNTRAIHEAVARYYRGPVFMQPGGPAGRSPETVHIERPDGLKEALRKRLHTLVNDEKVATQDVVILSPLSKHKSQLKEGATLGNLVLTWEQPKQPNQVQCATIHSFKGLERPVVMLVELDHLPRDQGDMLIYIGLSRAMHHLITFGHGADLFLLFTKGKNARS